jgi:myo-inositol-1(or 4)-monophosphatase
MNRREKARFELEMRHRINAGRVAVRDQLGFFSRQFGQVSSDWKADDTRVTFADFAISEKLFAALRRDFAGDDFCSEESNPQDESLRLEAPFAWVVDPIDGTNNYALGCPLCGISLALLYGGEPVYGFIYDHSTRDLLEGGPSYGLLRNQKKVDRDALAAEAQTMVGLHFPMDRARLMALSPILARYRARCFGSGALNAAYVATGYLTGVIDFRIKVWDIAAAHALCAGVGVAWHFFGERPFPLRVFHPAMGHVPYYAGSDALCAEIAAALAESY